MLPDQKLTDKIIQAEKSFANDDREEAIKIYEGLIVEDANHESFFHKRIAYIATNEVKEMAKAEQILLDLMKKYPDRPEYNTALGEMYYSGSYQKQDEAKAEEQYKLAIEKGTKDDEAYQGLIWLYGKHYDFQKIMEVMESFIKNVPEEYYVIVSNYKTLAEFCINQGMEQRAIDIFQSMLKRKTTDSSLKIGLAQLYYKINPEKAKQMYEKYIKEYPNEGCYHEALAEFYREEIKAEFKKNKNLYAEEGYTFAENIDAAFLQKHPDFNQLFQAQIEQYEKAIEMGNCDFSVYSQLIKLYKQTGRNEKIEEVAKLKIEKFKNYSSSYLDLIDYFVQEGKINGISKLYKEMKSNCAKDSNYGSIAFFISYLKQNGDTKNTIDAYEWILRILGKKKDENIANKKYFYEYAEFLRKIGQEKKAGKIIKQGIKQYPTEKEYFQRFFGK